MRQLQAGCGACTFMLLVNGVQSSQHVLTRLIFSITACVHVCCPLVPPCSALGCSGSCPAFHLPADLFVKHEQLVFAAAAALQLQQPLLDSLLRCVCGVMGSTGLL